MKEETLSFSPPFDQKILDRTKIRTARKRDKSGEFTINDERFEAVFEVAVTAPAFVSLFNSEFYTPEQFGFYSFHEMWAYYNEYFPHEYLLAGGLIFVHKISGVQS